MSEISRCTLVPKRFLSDCAPICFLKEVSDISWNEKVACIDIPHFDAVLVYSGPKPSLADLLFKILRIPEHNKIAASFEGGVLSLAIAQGDSLLLANTYRSQDFTTALYYIVAAMKSLQLNPEVSTICFSSRLQDSERTELYRYFKAVSRI